MKRLGAWIAVAGMALVLAGCLLIPGKFASSLDVRRDGTFRFAYKGEIVVLALTDLADTSKDDAGPPPGTREVTLPPTCHDDNGDEHPCAEGEKPEGAEAAAAEAERKKAEAEAMARAMLGGIDPHDPRASAMFTEKLRQQAGWKSVVDKGHGVFEVDYEIAGRLDHDFSFPTIEQMPVVTPFLAVFRHADGTVRVVAPAFSASSSGGPMMAMLGASDKAKGKGAGVPPMDGTFAITTDGEILANNTDAGPSAPAGGGKRLDWRVTTQTASAPTALIRLAR